MLGTVIISRQRSHWKSLRWSTCEQTKHLFIKRSALSYNDFIISFIISLWFYLLVLMVNTAAMLSDNSTQINVVGGYRYFPQSVFISRIFFSLFNCSWIHLSVCCSLVVLPGWMSSEKTLQSRPSWARLDFRGHFSSSKWRNEHYGECGVTVSSGTSGFLSCQVWISSAWTWKTEDLSQTLTSRYISG